MKHAKLLLATTNYKYLADAIYAQQVKRAVPIPVGNSNPESLREGVIYLKTWPDKETYHKLADHVSGRNVVIVGGTVSDAETMELFDIACHVAKEGARTLTLVIPYFGYSTMERAVEYGEIVKAKNRAILLSAIPATCKRKILFIDLHSEGTPHYLEGPIQTVHMYAKKIVMKMAKRIAAADGEEDTLDFVLASTDSGRAKWVESLANDMGVEFAVITKRRLSGSSTEVVGINADVKGKKVVMYDDMIRTGGSLIGAAKAYKDAGASKVYAVATHAVLPNDSLQKMQLSGFIEKVYVTNTHPRSMELHNMIYNGVAGTTDLGKAMKDDFYKVFSVAPMLQRYLSKH
jgi:ribose-phosphate pyrophosphokinase